MQNKKLIEATLHGDNQRDIMKQFNALFPDAVLKELDNHTPNVAQQNQPVLSDDKVQKEYDWFKRRYFNAKMNEEVGIYLWGKMSEHNAEMHYLKHQYYFYRDELNSRGLQPLTHEVK